MTTEVEMKRCVFCGRTEESPAPPGGFNWRCQAQDDHEVCMFTCSEICRGKYLARQAAAPAEEDRTVTDVERLIAEECEGLRRLLVTKNRAYGNSALDPVRIFSRASSEEQIRVRLDDKLSRLAKGSAEGEDVELDLMGYLVLLRIARRMVIK